MTLENATRLHKHFLKIKNVEKAKELEAIHPELRKEVKSKNDN